MCSLCYRGRTSTNTGTCFSPHPAPHYYHDTADLLTPTGRRSSLSAVKAGALTQPYDFHAWWPLLKKSRCPRPEKVAGQCEKSLIIVHEGGRAVVSSVMQRFPHYPQDVPHVVDGCTLSTRCAARCGYEAVCELPGWGPIKGCGPFL